MPITDEEAAPGTTNAWAVVPVATAETATAKADRTRHMIRSDAVQKLKLLSFVGGSARNSEPVALPIAECMPATRLLPSILLLLLLITL